MGNSRMINVVGLHAGGCVGHVIVGGVLNVPGQTMFDKMHYLETQADELRQILLQEPRSMGCANLILPSNNPAAAAGFVIMEPEFYVPMSGSNTMCVATALLETGMIPMVEPVTKFTLEAPGGLVHITAECENGKCKNVTFDNVPSFVFGLDYKVEVPGIGTVDVDVAYGGMIYAIVDAQKFGFEVKPSEARDLVSIGEKIKAAAAEQCPAIHPENPGIHTINQTMFATPVTKTDEGLRSRNAVIISPGFIDRSPCGTGTSARLAVMRARGDIAVGETFIHESITDTIFTGRVLEDLKIAGQDGIRPAITGSAWITGFHNIVVDETDPFPTGFRL